MKISKNYIPIVLALFLVFGILLGRMLSISNQDGLRLSKNKSHKIFQLLDLIDREYVDSVSTDSLLDHTISQLLENLDPHSVYIPSSEMDAVAQEMRGDFGGIGVIFYMHKDTLAVIKTLPNSPSEKAGIMAGDRILYANQKQLYGKKLPLDSIFSTLKGAPGTDVQLQLFRKKTNKKLQVAVTRDVIPVKSVDVALALTDTLGYIKINRFAETTHAEFRTGLLKLKKKGIQSLLIDVRDNGGGYLDQAIAIADELLADKQLIVFTKNKSGRVNDTFATAKGDFESGSVYILIDENSASASEVLAGAIQDNDRGTIVGRRSFGKGLVQREISFEDKSAVRLTVAKYYTPTGRSIQRSYKEGSEAYFGEFAHRFETGELYKKDSIKIADTLQFKTKKGKIVYGGGGIVPDIFVPFGTEHGQEGVLYLMKSPMVANFAFRQIDAQRSKFENYSQKELASVVATSDYYFDAFCKSLVADGVVKNADSFKKSSNKSIVKTYLWAAFAEQLFGDEVSYKIMLHHDPMIQVLLTR